MKRLNSIILAFLILIGVLLGMTACSEKNRNDKLSVVVTIFPAYDWVCRILGDNVSNVDVTLLSGTGVDLHSYQPTVADMAKISTCDMFIYVGGESDIWVDDALASATNKNMKVINMFDVLGDAILEEEIADGMEHEEAEHEEEYEGDEHIWLSLSFAKTLCSYIANRFAEIDPENAGAYAENAKKYNAELSKLDSEYRAVADEAAYHTLLFADRFPFRYLTEDYGLSYYAAFSGCSAETEASVQTIAFLAEKLTELRLPAVIIIEGSDGRIASTVIKAANGNQAVLSLNSLQSVTESDIANGISYLSVMKNNLEVLKEALN